MKHVWVIAIAIAACSHHAAPAPANPPSSAAACPAPKQTTDVCAAVITYAKDPAGTCCEYPTPCQVPFPGPQYSDATCATAPGPATPQ